MKFIVRQEDATARWVWELVSPANITLAKSGNSCKSLHSLLAQIRTMRAVVPQLLVFDLLGRLQERS